MTTRPLQSQPADSRDRHLRNLTPADKALLTRAGRNGRGEAVRRSLALAYERFGDEIRDAGGIYNVPAFRDPDTAALLLQRFGSGDQIHTGGDTWQTQWQPENIPQSRPGRIDIADVWFEEYVDALSQNPNLGSADLYEDARQVRRRLTDREQSETRRIHRELVGRAHDFHQRLPATPTPADVERLETELQNQAERVIEATDNAGRRHRRYELEDGSALVVWHHPRHRGNTVTEQTGVGLATHRARLTTLPTNLRYPALFNVRSEEDAAPPVSVREYQAIEHGGSGDGTLVRHRAAPSPNVDRDYLTYSQGLRREGRIDVRDPRISSPGGRIMRLGPDAPPPRDLRAFAGRQAGPDAEEWRSRLGSDPDATPDDDLAQLEELNTRRSVRPDGESVRLSFPDASNAVIDLRRGEVQPVGQRARSAAPRAAPPEPRAPELAENDDPAKLPFRFADGGTAVDPADDPARALPGVYLDPEANRETVGEYGRLWQAQSGHDDAEGLRSEGKPVQADLRDQAADAWLRSTEPGPPRGEGSGRRTSPRLAQALSSLVSLEGEADHHIEDWLADLNRRSQDQRAEHYRIAEREQGRGHTEQAAIHQRIADQWADPSQGVQREVIEPALESQGWRVVSLEDDREFFDQRVYRFRDPKTGRFAVWRGFYTHDLAAVHQLIRERYGATAYLAQYTDTRRGIESAHPFAVIDGTVHGAYDPQNLAAPQPITHIYIPPPGWTPPNFQPDPDRLAAREERRRTQRDAGRAATPAEVTDDVEDIYERVASGTNYTESQAADIRLAIREAQEAAAEASAAADRAALLSNTAQGLARGARADLRRTGELSGDGDLGIGDALQDGDEPTHVDDPQPADTFDALIGPEIPDTAGGEIANAVDGPTDGDSPSPVPRRSGRRLTLEELQEVVAAGGDLRSPADIADRALYKAEKANDIADEAMQASQEAVLAASRMTRAFARLRQLTRDAKRQADGLPDDVDDVAQTYADMAEAEIDGTMPIVERTNRVALESRDMALLAAEEADEVLADVRQVRTSLHNDLGDAYTPPTPEQEARARASERYTREIESTEELEGRIEDLRARVETRQAQSGAPDRDTTDEDDTGVELQPQLTPGRVYIPEGQPTVLGKDSTGRKVRGYRVSGEFYPAADLNPVVDSSTGRQAFQDPPEWVYGSEPGAARRLLYSTNVLPKVETPPPPRAEPAKDEPPPGPKELRDYQELLITELDDALEKQDSVLVTAPTGAGKTVTFAEKIRRLRQDGQTVAVIAHRQELIEQAEKTIAAQTGERPGVVWQDRREWGRPITIIAHGALLTNDPPVGYRPDVVIADEAHHVTAPGWQQAIDKLKPRKLIGFTATPFRTDEQPLTPEPFARVIRPVTPPQLIEKGVLVPPKVESVALTDAQGNRQPINRANNLPQVYAESVSYALSQGRRKIILFVSQSADQSPSEVARNTQRELLRLGITTRTIIAGDLSPAARKEAVKDFEEAPSAVMVNYMTLTEGTDVPSTDTVVLGRNTQSETALIQMIGRGMRPSAGKRNVLVLDYTDRDDIADIVNYWRLDDGAPTPDRSRSVGQSRQSAGRNPLHYPRTGFDIGKTQYGDSAPSKIMRRDTDRSQQPPARAAKDPSAPAVFRQPDAPPASAPADEFAHLDAPRPVMGSRARRRRRRSDDLEPTYTGGEITLTIDGQQ